jgi:hypothetical protein
MVNGTGTAARGTRRYTVAAAARQLGLSARGIRRRIETGTLPAECTPHGWRITADALAVALADAVQDGTSADIGGTPTAVNGTTAAPIPPPAAPVPPGADPVPPTTASLPPDAAARLAAVEAVLAEVRGERDELRTEVERLHERLREAHVLLAQERALPAPRDDAPPGDGIAVGPTTLRPWWAALLWWRR